MSRNLSLPDEEVWQPDGHLSDVALTVLADGERDLLSEAALRHANECDGCTARLGEQALLSMSLGEALQAAPVVAPVRFPAAALVIALVVAGIGALPAILQAPRWLASVPGALVQSVPVALRAAFALGKVASSGSATVVAIWIVATTVLCAIGLIIARLAPREIAWKGVRK